MTSFFSTKYPNNSRVVSGTATIYRDDVVLLCDTSSAPVVINLFDIPDGFWSTQWKLYIVDYSNNAGTNSITINAGGTQQINDAASLVLNVNGTSAVVEIVSDDKFIGNLTSASGSGGGGYDTIQEEGVSLTQRTTLDVVGKFGTASDTGSKTQLEINPTIEAITNANFLAGIAANTLTKGLTYKITDPLYGEAIYLQALETNLESLSAQAKFYFPDYNGGGDYTSVSPTFNSQLGRWNGGLTVVIGDVVIWNNNHYVNITGSVGTDPSTDVANWTLLAKTLTTGFREETCDVLYNATTNIPFVIKDIRGNEVWYNNFKGVVSLNWFPFGDDSIQNNTVKGQESAIQYLCNVPFQSFFSNVCLNSSFVFTNDFSAAISAEINYKDNYVSGARIGIQNGFIPLSSSITFQDNTLYGGNLEIAAIDTTFSAELIIENNLCQGGQCFLGDTSIIGTNNISVQGNTFHLNAGYTFVTIDSSINTIDINNNVVGQNSTGTISLVSNADDLIDFIGNRIDENQDITGTFTSNALQGGLYSVLSKEKSTFRKPLDLSDATDYDLATLTLNLGSEEYIGEYLITGAGEVINKIDEGTTSERPYTLIAQGEDGVLRFRLTYTTIAAAVTDVIIQNTGINSKTLFYSYTNYSDRCTFIRSGGLIGFNTIISNVVSA